MSPFEHITPKQLLAMAEARQRDQWNHTAQLSTIIANLLVMKKSDLLPVSRFHPFMRTEKLKPAGETFSEQLGRFKELLT